VRMSVTLILIRRDSAAGSGIFFRRACGYLACRDCCEPWVLTRYDRAHHRAYGLVWRRSQGECSGDQSREGRDGSHVPGFFHPPGGTGGSRKARVRHAALPSQGSASWTGFLVYIVGAQSEAKEASTTLVSATASIERGMQRTLMRA
jgi:hypothetical protein